MYSLSDLEIINRDQICHSNNIMKINVKIDWFGKIPDGEMLKELKFEINDHMPSQVKVGDFKLDGKWLSFEVSDSIDPDIECEPYVQGFVVGFLAAKGVLCI